uniref:Uncharacterized protein n=1 Tax=Citrobacter freundii TaxID=546 RepID=A0A2R4AKP3_CITFR|nr:hypothetical protein [Citrobacter freundii]
MQMNVINKAIAGPETRVKNAKLRQAVVWRCKLARNVIMICHSGF